ncbi:MAG: hypothetical protein R3Y33_07630 [Clostridia bacterium]
MYSKLPYFVFGFHGCSEETYNSVIKEGKPLLPSDNDYDWLGHGIYFWESNLERAVQWAEEQAKQKHYKPAVIGAIIDLGHCLNLLDSSYISLIKNHYDIFKGEMEAINSVLPKNTNVGKNTDLLLRRLDCAVINHLHEDRKYNNEKAFDSVRGMFLEGNPIYPDAGFREKAHIQIAVRNIDCIKGYFSPLNNKFLK